MRFQASLRDAVPCVRAYPALETPGYCQTVPIRLLASLERSGQALRDLRSVPQLREDSIEGCERSDARGPVGTTENSPPVHWRECVTKDQSCPVGTPEPNPEPRQHRFPHNENLVVWANRPRFNLEESRF